MRVFRIHIAIQLIAFGVLIILLHSSTNTHIVGEKAENEKRVENNIDEDNLDKNVKNHLLIPSGYINKRLGVLNKSWCLNRSHQNQYIPSPKTTKKYLFFSRLKIPS